MSRAVWAWVRLLIGVAILLVLVRHVDTGPFLDGLRAVDGPSLAAAVILTLLTTVCSAWRWRVVAQGLGVGLSLGAATAAYYRSQFLNTVLPGGVLGDVHRAVAHGRDAGDVGRGLRAVAWERSAGQVVQVTLTVLVLLGLPSPARPFLPLGLAVLLVAAVVALLVLRALPRTGAGRAARAVRAARADVRDGLLARRAWPVVALTSLLIVAGHTTTFVVAVRTAGVDAPIAALLPLVLLVMLAMTLPTNVGGWGPREGAAAALFALAGLGSAHGVSAAILYGVLVLVGTLPGAVVLVLAPVWRRHHPAPVALHPDPTAGAPVVTATTTTATVEGGVRG